MRFTRRDGRGSEMSLKIKGKAEFAGLDEWEAKRKATGVRKGWRRLQGTLISMRNVKEIRSVPKNLGMSASDEIK